MKIKAETGVVISNEEAIRITLATLQKEFDLTDSYYIADGHIFEDIDVCHYKTDIQCILIREAKSIDKSVLKVIKHLKRK